MLPLGHMGTTLLTVRTAAWLLNLKSIDYRVLLVGSILPDLIDKPLGLLFSSTGMLAKSFGHSLLFLVLLFSTCKLLRNNPYKNLLKTLGIGSTLHDVFDLMWHFPKALFWPAAISVLPKTPYEPWGQIIHFHRIHLQQVVALEFVGGGILLFFFIELLITKKLTSFLKVGERPYRNQDRLSSKKTLEDN